MTCFEHKGFTFGSQGDGKFPTCCYQGTPFSQDHHPEFAKSAGEPLAPGWRAVLDGFHGDADYIHKTFKLKRLLPLSYFAQVSTLKGNL